LEQGKQLMDAARARIEEIEGTENRLLQQREAQRHSRQFEASTHSHETMFWLLSMRNHLPQPMTLPALTFLFASVVAGQLLGQGPSASLNQADADYREGVAALNRNDLATAQSKFEAVIRLTPSSEQGHAALGAVLARERRFESAIAEYQKALAIKPGDASVQLNLASAYVESGEPAKAVALYAKAAAAARAQQKPLPPSVLASYANALAAAGQSAAAIAQMREVTAQQPRNPQLRDELGTLYARAQDWPRAEQEYSEAIRLKPDFASAHFHLGFVFQAEKKPEAVQEWLAAYKLNPQDPGVALTVGRALSEAGQDEQAEPILEHAHELAPQSTQAAYQLALVWQRANRMEDANVLLKRVVEAEPENADALINLGLGLSQTQHARDAAPYLQRAIAIHPENVTAHQDLAAAYIEMNQTDAAIAELQAALKLAPDSPQLHYNLGAAYKFEDDAAHAIPELETAAKLDPNAYEPQYLLGVLYMQQARYEEAAARLEASLKLHSQNGDAWATLGSVYNKLDRLPEAVAALQEAIRQLPDQADPHLTLAAVLVKQKQTAEATVERKTAANLMRAHMDFERAEVATNSGKSQMAAGKIDDAIQEFRNAIGFDADYTEAHAELATALEMQGKKAEADAERACAAALESRSGAPDAATLPAACSSH
jgi:tetratricopeptide (TPR) repeat protein